MTSYFYSHLISPLSSVLLQEVIILGLFFVFAGLVRAFFAARDEGRRFPLLKRGVLVWAVLLFVLYNTISYRLDAASAGSPPVGEDLTMWTTARLLLLAPLDLALIVVSAALFIVIGYENLLGGEQHDKIHRRTHATEDDQLAREMRRVFMLTGLWHGLVVVWWLLFLGEYKTGVVLGSAAFHVVIGGLHTGCGVAWRRVSNGRAHGRAGSEGGGGDVDPSLAGDLADDLASDLPEGIEIDHGLGARAPVIPGLTDRDGGPRISAWVPIAAYLAIVSFVYVFRLHWYIEEAVRTSRATGG